MSQSKFSLGPKIQPTPKVCISKEKPKAPADPNQVQASIDWQHFDDTDPACEFHVCLIMSITWNPATETAHGQASQAGVDLVYDANIDCAAEQGDAELIGEVVAAACGGRAAGFNAQVEDCSAQGLKLIALEPDDPLDILDFLIL